MTVKWLPWGKYDDESSASHWLEADHLKAALWACKHDRVLGALGLPELATSWGLDGLEQLLAATLAHHGRPARLPNTSGKGPPDIWRPFAEYDPLETARRLNKLSREWFPRTGGDRLEADDAPIAPRMAPPHGRG